MSLHVLCGMNLNVYADKERDIPRNWETVRKQYKITYSLRFFNYKVNFCPFSSSSYLMQCNQIAGMKNKNRSSAVCLPS